MLRCQGAAPEDMGGIREGTMAAGPSVGQARCLRTQRQTWRCPGL